ncbi:thioesterase II family protein [Streptomyces sp. NPDC102441]|uniref:thioesterase II family protein n=1 Tax=Streptomyces sp. NPDC102441 TaxID=3366176 RepID=UPI00381A49C4
MTLHEGTEAVVTHSRWLAGAARLPRHAVRLYCLPFLGGPADFFLPLVRELPSWVEPCPVELPGYGKRFREPAVRNVLELARLLAEVIDHDRAGRPYAIFGHCAGGLLAFEATRHLRLRARPQPTLLAVSSTHPPHQWHHMTAALKTRPLQRLKPLLLELAAQRSLHVASAEAVTKREVTAYLRYRHAEEAPLDCPISVFGGREDSLVVPECLSAWADLSHGRVRHRIYPGRHFYVDGHWPDIARSLTRDLQEALGLPRTP